jgi:chromosome segregation ATPase
VSDDKLTLEDHEVVVRDLVRSMERFRTVNTTLNEVGAALSSAATQFGETSQRLVRLTDRVSQLADQVSEAAKPLEQFDPSALLSAVKHSSSVLSQELAGHQQAVTDWRQRWESAHHSLQQQHSQINQRLLLVADKLDNLTNVLREIQHTQTTQHENVANELGNIRQQLDGARTQINGMRSQIEDTQQAAEQAAKNVVGMTQTMIDEVSVPIGKRLDRLSTINLTLLLLNAILTGIVLTLIMSGWTR